MKNKLVKTGCVCLVAYVATGLTAIIYALLLNISNEPTGIAAIASAMTNDPAALVRVFYSSAVLMILIASLALPIGLPIWLIALGLSAVYIFSDKLPKWTLLIIGSLFSLLGYFFADSWPRWGGT
jgi:hypothetical protein